MKEKLLKLLKAKQEAREAKVKLGDDCTDIKELRDIQKEVEALDEEIRNIQSMIDELPKEDKGDNGQVQRTAVVNGDIPGVVISNTKGQEQRENTVDIEERAKKLAETGRMSINAAETRSILLDTGTLAKPTKVGGINEPFNTVSSIVDLVFIEDLTGVGAYKEAYMKSWQTAQENTAYGTAPTPSDPVFRTVAINPFPLDVLTYVGKNLRKQTPLAYEEKVRRGALIALRKKLAAWIVNGNGTTKAYGIYNAVNTEETPESLIEELLVAKDYKIDATTLRKIVFAYGGDENVVTGAKLFLNKNDLIAFGDVRGTNEKKAVYEIIPDGSNPTTGIIKDGGLSVPYVICSDVTALTGSSETGASRIKTMIYGEPYAYKVGLFGDYEINVSEDYKFGEGLLTVKGEVMAGGNVVVDKGFVVVTKKATTDN